jgi:hypothetical protein
LIHPDIGALIRSLHHARIFELLISLELDHPSGDDEPLTFFPNTLTPTGTPQQAGRTPLSGTHTIGIAPSTPGMVPATSPVSAALTDLAGNGNGSGNGAAVSSNSSGQSDGNQGPLNVISVERFKSLGRLMGISDAHLVKTLEANRITFFATIHASVSMSSL